MPLFETIEGFENAEATMKNFIISLSIKNILPAVVIVSLLCWGSLTELKMPVILKQTGIFIQPRKYLQKFRMKMILKLYSLMVEEGRRQEEAERLTSFMLHKEKYRESSDRINNSGANNYQCLRDKGSGNFQLRTIINSRY